MYYFKNSLFKWRPHYAHKYLFLHKGRKKRNRKNYPPLTD